MTQRLASISVDLDSLPHYCRIHGLDEAILDQRARNLVYQVAVPRFRKLFDELGVGATLFAIGEDLQGSSGPLACTELRESHQSGIEIASHSYHHHYDLALREPAAIAEDLRRADEIIGQAVGKNPVGFRAPGYTLSKSLWRAIWARGYLYDSSTFPAAPYYLGKAAVMGLLRLSGRPSLTILDRPSVLIAPQRPYFPDADEPYRVGLATVLELPIATTPLLRFPFIGTFAVALPLGLIQTAYRLMKSTPFFNFELHAVDVLDANDGIPGALVERQRDLLIPHSRKLERLKRIFEWLRADYRVATLADAASALRQFMF